MPCNNSLSVFSPVKINLYLHITGIREDGYHLLDSLVCFADDIGDRLELVPNSNGKSGFKLEITGDFSGELSGVYASSSRDSKNLVSKAVWSLLDNLGKAPDFKIILKKNIPVSAGIGGGSSNAAATVRLLLEYWGVDIDSPETGNVIDNILIGLGADVPACFEGTSLKMGGVGEVIEKVPEIPNFYILLVNPGIMASTPEVFAKFDRSSTGYSKNVTLPQSFGDAGNFADFLKNTGNDLAAPAIAKFPVIGKVIRELQQQEGILLSRMSGSGATVFGLFNDAGLCEKAKKGLLQKHPQWWIRAGGL